MSLETEISGFINTIIEESRITNPRIIESARVEISSKLEEFLTLRLSEELSENDREELFDLIATFPRSFNLYDYFSNKFIDFEYRIKLLLPEFKKIYFVAN